MTLAKGSQKPGWISLEGPFSSADIRSLRKNGNIEKLSLTKQNLVTAEIAKGFCSLESVEWVWLWCSVTRTAMREVIAIPNLRTLDVLEIRYPGKLQNFAAAEKLAVFRANHYMSEEDLFEVSKLPALEELGAQNAAISEDSLAALLEMPNLRDLDLEATAFNDDMAAAIAQIKRITKLDVGATLLTRKGLRHICGMKQLRSLDIWATNIAEEDLDMLADLPGLEYLSVGGYEGQKDLTSNGVLPRLERIKSLKRVWLDGIPITDKEKGHLEERYEKVRL